MIAAIALVVGGCGLATSGPPTAESVDPSVVRELEEFITPAEVSPQEYEAAIAESVGACMRRNGFRYLTFIPGEGELATELSEEERVAEDGFGMVASIEAIGQALVIDDPNEEARAELAPEGQAAWDSALADCSRTAIGEAPDLGGNATLSAEADAIIGDARARATADPRVLQAVEDWGVCMNQAGYDYSTRDEMLGEIAVLADRFALPFVDALNALLAEGDYQGAEDLRMRDVLPPEEYEEYEAAIALELKLATTDLGCKGDIDEIYDEVYFGAIERVIGSGRP